MRAVISAVVGPQRVAEEYSEEDERNFENVPIEVLVNT